MTTKNGKNKNLIIEAKINEIAIVNDHKLRPFIETFNVQPVNIAQQTLGNLFGFFKIKNTSEDSAYIVNFLDSVLKKEYYINPKRSIEDSFDASLNKINIALSEIAKNGNIGWMGTLESAVCVIKDNMIYFAVTGTAKVMLLRKRYLSDISKGLSSEEGRNHPIKTFTNVSSGLINAQDKIIVTSEEIFKIFSENEIKKNAERLPHNKFVRFLKTAMINELDLATTFVVDIVEKKLEILRASKNEYEKENLNFFSANVYNEKKRKNTSPENVEKQQEYTDEKTGHIYVVGEKDILPAKNKFFEIFLEIKEKLSDTLNAVSKNFYPTLTKIKKKLLVSLKKGSMIAIQSAKTTISEIKITTEKSAFKEKIHPNAVYAYKKIFSILRSLLPNFSRIKEIFLNLSYQQKIISVLIVFFIVVAPLVLKHQNQNENFQTETKTQFVEISNREKLANEKNIKFDFAISKLKDQDNFKMVEFMDPYIILLSEEKIVAIRENNPEKEIMIPDNQRIITACKMSDLKLIFILTENHKVFSFSPISGELKENLIDLPVNAKIKAIASYLTYLYLADLETGNIYRYPRAEGGFGKKTIWLKQSFDMETITDMTIDENIYLSTPSTINKFFKGERSNINFENSITLINYSRVNSEPKYSNIYILDAPNGRVIVYGKDGRIINQYYDQQIEGAKDFSVDEKNNKVIVISSNAGVIQFSL